MCRSVKYVIVLVCVVGIVILVVSLGFDGIVSGSRSLVVSLAAATFSAPLFVYALQLLVLLVSSPFWLPGRFTVSVSCHHEQTSQALRMKPAAAEGRTDRTGSRNKPPKPIPLPRATRTPSSTNVGERNTLKLFTDTITRNPRITQPFNTENIYLHNNLV